MEQPKPTPNTEPAVRDLVLADMKRRDAQGAAKYGTRLQPFNGRSFERDAYEVELDLSVYLRGMIEERQRIRAVLTEAALYAGKTGNDALVDRILEVLR